MPRLHLAAALLVVGPFAPVEAQQPQPLGRPLVEYAEPFSRITGVRELADGRLIIADSREKTLQLIDLTTGASRPISREGRGPGEWLSIVGLLPLPRSETLVADGGNRRFLKLGADGDVIETVAPPALGTTPGASPAMAGFAVFGLITARAVDQWGRIHFEPVNFSREGAPAPDSIPILRWGLGRADIDTVGWRRSAGSGMVWAPSEQWQAMPDGRIVRASPTPYRLTLVDSSGRSAEGPAVRFAPVRVTEADREEVRNRQRSQMAQVGQAMRAQAPSAGGAPPAPRVPEIQFAETKPPFYGSQAIEVAPDGEIWILRTNAFGDSVPVYDVFNENGQLHRRVALPARSRLVGFGQRTVYIVRVDEDDLEWLQKYARP
jgi:hypothetical protein